MKPMMLIVEDELFVRMDFVDQAQEAGFETVEAGSAAEAVEILERRDDIHVVFTDIRMPGDMDGLALAHMVRDRWPPTIIVICSGNEPPAKEELPSGVTFMPKPCSGPKIDQLLTSIKIELNAGTAL
jgi:two-component system, response regulator PdtaR